MTRQRDIPSIQYRTPNQINMTLPVRPGIDRFEIRGAARLVDAYGTVAGLTGGGALPMFQITNGGDFRSKGIRMRRLPAIEESSRGLTRMVFDPDDFATPVQVSGTTYLPGDDQVLFLRVAAHDQASNTFLPEGPIMIVPSYDFFTTKEPTLTVTGQAPNLAVGAFPPNIPDAMPAESLNFLLPAYSTTVSIKNLEAAAGQPLFVSFHPGTPPTVLMPGDDISLTGAGIPEFFIGSPNGNAWFSIRMAVVNSA